MVTPIDRLFNQLAPIYIFSDSTIDEDVCSISSKWFLQRMHQFGLRLQFANLLWSFPVLIHLCKRVQMKNWHFFWILDFQRFLKILGLMLDSSLWSTICIAFFKEAIENWPLEFSFHVGVSVPPTMLGAGRKDFILAHCWSSKLLNDLRCKF